MVLPYEPEFQQAYDELVSAIEDSTLFQEEPKYKKSSQLFLSQKEVSNSELLGKTIKVKLKSTTVTEFNTTLPWVHTKVVCVSTQPSTYPS